MNDATNLDRRQAAALDAYRNRDFARAAELAGQLVEHDPNRAAAWHLLGMARHGQGESAAAVECLARAVALESRSAEFHTHRAEVCRAAGRLDEAVAAGREAVRLRPDSAAAHNNLGLALAAHGQLHEAEASFREAVRIQPNYARGHYNLAHALARHERSKEAFYAAQRALQLRPDYPQALHLLGTLLHAQRRSAEALEFVERALRLQPCYPAALITRGRALQALGRLDEALASYRQAATLDADNLDALVESATLQGDLCDWQDFASNGERLRQASLTRQSDEQTAPLGAGQIARFPLSAAEQLAVARQTSSKLLRRVAPISRQLNFTYETHDRPRIRLGYLSGDFRNHATGHLLRSLFGLHDRSLWEVYAYSFGPDDGSSYRRQIAAGCDRFVDIAHSSPIDAARRIHADGIDILVDLMGYAGNARPEIVALRPAPIQVNYLGYPGSMGAEFIDYMLVDRVVVPPEQAVHYSECLAYLPHSYQCTDHTQPIAAAAPSRTEEGLPPTGFVFACFNSCWKIEPTVFDVWMRILRAVPAGVLWLLGESRYAPENLRREAAARGIDPARLVFAGLRPKAEHLARHRWAGLFLDTTLCNAHTTATDALWAGLPLITCPGETFASRVAASLLTAVGLPELIARDLDEYERLAVRLALDADELSAVRAKLAAGRTTQPLFDTPRFARNLEQAYRSMWRRRRAGMPPEAFFVEERTEPRATIES